MPPKKVHIARAEGTEGAGKCQRGQVGHAHGSQSVGSGASGGTLQVGHGSGVRVASGLDYGGVRSAGRGVRGGSGSVSCGVRVGRAVGQRGVHARGEGSVKKSAVERARSSVAGQSEGLEVKRDAGLRELFAKRRGYSNMNKTCKTVAPRPKSVGYEARIMANHNSMWKPKHSARSPQGNRVPVVGSQLGLL